MTPRPAPTEDTAAEDSTSTRGSRWALLLFGLVVVGSLPLLLVLGRHMWFQTDDWYFLADRELDEPGDLFRPHTFVHWSTVPIVVYRLLYRVVGLRSYLPYQVIVVGLHLTAAVLLRMVMRRAGVGPWIASIAASVFVLFGSGYPNIVWAFQIGFVGALVFGLTHLLLATHGGPLDRRDLLGLLAGAFGLMFSGVAVTMVAVVGLAALVQRGWRVAAIHTVPLGAVYSLWWFGYAQDPDLYERDSGDPGEWAAFTANGVVGTFDALGQLPGVGIALAAVLIVGLALAWGRLDAAELRQRAAAPGALLVGGVLFLVITALGRVSAGLGPRGLLILGTESGDSPRYLHFVAAMLLPALAVAADAIARRGRALAVVVALLLVVGVPGNIAAVADPDNPAYSERFQRGYRELILALPRVPVAEQLPRRVEPDPDHAYSVTIGWLRDAAESGRLPDPGAIRPRVAANATLRLALEQSDDPASDCADPKPPGLVRLDEGQSMTVEASSLRARPQIVYLADDGTESSPWQTSPFRGSTFNALAGPLTLRVGPPNQVASISVCG